MPVIPERSEVRSQTFKVGERKTTALGVLFFLSNNVPVENTVYAYEDGDVWATVDASCLYPLKATDKPSWSYKCLSAKENEPHVHF